MKPETSDDKVLIKPIEADKITKGGIYIPDSAREFERKKTGIVICHGKGYVDQQTGELFPITVWEGCKVSFPAHLGQEFQGRDIGLEDGIYLLINERDIDVILDEDIRVWIKNTIDGSDIYHLEINGRDCWDNLP